MIKISRQLTYQKFIFKIHSERLRNSKWKLTLPLDEARLNDEIIALADSQVLRWIQCMPLYLGEGEFIEDTEDLAEDIRREIKCIKKQETSLQNKKKIKRLYSELDRVQFVPDYMSLIIDKKKDYYRACKGFSINGIEYKRLLGTNGGIKNSTIVFVSKRVWEELNKRIENGRNTAIPLVAAKFEAYKALTCSASIPVSMPNKIAVVDDCETSYITDYIYVTDDKTDEPTLEYRKNAELSMNATDGFGLMTPELAERWSDELGLDYVSSGMCCRFAFTKGMVYPFDFRDFAEKECNGSYIVKDAWGNNFDVRDVELILTTSMVKLWDSYSSCDEFVEKSLANDYSFAITKTAPKQLENEHELNYQFIQSYDLDDNDIKELVMPTVNEIKDILGLDWRKTVLFMGGSNWNKDTVIKTLQNGSNGDTISSDVAKALMINPNMIKDPFIVNIVYQTIKKKIEDAKVGVLKVHGNYSMASGDPFTLCQHMFGLPITGLLKAGEIYNKYWIENGADKLVCFRAPMSCFNNIRCVKPVHNEKIDYWFRYMNTCTIFNSWDSSAAALNGMDFDGDLVMLTDNKVLVRKHYPTPALVCIQRKADRSISKEEDFIKSNINSFGNEIGQTTNYITSMYEMRAHFDKDSVEYKTLSYRIQSGQNYQQNAIDKTKGIICKPMPQNWHNRYQANKIEDSDARELYCRISVDKKPYFMIYIYPELKRKYRKYIKNTNSSAIREFGLGVKELQNLPADKLSDEQKAFLKYYNYDMPVGLGECVMNKICWTVEKEFENIIFKINENNNFDYSIMRSDTAYTSNEYYSIKQIYEDYLKNIQEMLIRNKKDKQDKYSCTDKLLVMEQEFKRRCDEVCPNEKVQCNIILDLCYKKKNTKSFVWNICDNAIINNLLENANYTVSFPEKDDSGNLDYCGQTYKINVVNIKKEGA